MFGLRYSELIKIRIKISTRTLLNKLCPLSILDEIWNVVESKQNLRVTNSAVFWIEASPAPPCPSTFAGCTQIINMLSPTLYPSSGRGRGEGGGGGREGEGGMGGWGDGGGEGDGVMGCR